MKCPKCGEKIPLINCRAAVFAGALVFIVSFSMAVFFVSKKILDNPPAGAGKTAGVSATIKAKVGDDFAIMLDSNRTTGYEWQLARALDGNIIKLVKSEYVPEESGRVGSGGQEEWVFRAMGPGDTSVSFKYVRSWEKGIKAAKEKTLYVTIER